MNNHFSRIAAWDNSIREVTREISAKALEYLPEGGVLVDVGANTGMFSELVLEQRRCTAFLFEPVPDYYNYSAAKFRSVPTVTIENFALSDAPGEFSLWIDSANLGWNTMEGTKQTPGMREIRVKTVTFDDYAAARNIDRIDVLKIDVEGAEYRVLGGMKKTLARLKRKPVILLEIGWGPNGHPAWDKEVEIFEWLFQNGYQRFDYNVPGTSDVVILPLPESQATATLVQPEEVRITVGIPTRNRLQPLLELIHSITRQTFRNFELLISDDGDQYDLPAAIRQVFPNLEFRYIKGPGINLPCNRQNIIDNARTELVLTCDDDHYMREDCIEHLVHTMLTSDSIGIVSAIWPREDAPTINFDQVKNLTEFRLNLEDINATSHFWWENGYKTFDVFHSPAKVLEAEIAGGGCLLYRKSAVQVAGGFPDYYSTVSFREDTDISHRMFLKGYRILIDTRAIAHHHWVPSGGCRDSQDVKRLREEDGTLFLNKLDSWRRKQKRLTSMLAAGRPIRVLAFYDEEGWAWWHRSHNIRKHLGSSIEFSILKLGSAFDHNGYDFIFIYDDNLIAALPNVPRQKIIVGCSCPRYLERATATVEREGCAALIVNNYVGYRAVRQRVKAFCCQNGVDTELFQPAPREPSRLTACWVGHSQSVGNKGLELIREACALSGIELLVLDQAEKRDHSETWPQERVRDEIYQRASVYICASEFEGTPNPALEAMACGLPVISTPVGNIPELIIDGYNGYIVERSVAAIAAAIDRLKRGDCRLLGRHARTTVEGGWSWNYQTRKYEHAFQELMANEATGTINSIAWIRTDSIGDNILAAAMLPHLQQNFPQARITVVCQQHIAELYEASPYVNGVIAFDKKRAIIDQQYLQQLQQQIRNLQADLCLNSVFSREPLTDILSLSSNSGERIAWHGDFANGMTEGFRRQANELYTKILPSNSVDVGEIERHRLFLQGIGIEAPQLQPAIWTTEDDKRFADTFFRDNSLVPEKTLALFAGALVDMRTYTGYGMALDGICRQEGLAVVALGGKEDDTINRTNLAGLTVQNVNLSGRTTLRQAAEIIRRCRIAVGAETSLAHIACAVGTPNVILLGGGHFGRFMPYSPLTSVACLPLECYGCDWKCRYPKYHCVKDVKPTVITEALHQTLKEPSDQPRAFIQPEQDWPVQPGCPAWRMFSATAGRGMKQITVRCASPSAAPPVSIAPPIAGNYTVTAIVSTYNSAEFMTECLQDLVGQTINNELEIIVVDAASPQNEGEIVREFQKYHPNIRYIRTQERIGIYAAWNLAIRHATGTYIAPFSTNDRLRRDAFAILKRALDANPDVMLVYGDTYHTKIPHETFERHTCCGTYKWPDYSFKDLLYNCLVGPHPMWRRKVHDAIGYFDESYTAIGDQEFWLRMGERFRLLHIPEFTGLYWLSDDALSTRAGHEAQEIQLKYQARHMARLKGENSATTRKKLVVAIYSLELLHDACARIRLVAPFEKLGNEVEFLWGVTVDGAKCNTNLNMIDAADLIIVQRFYPRLGSEALVERLFASGKPVIYEADDLLIDLPLTNPHRQWAEETVTVLRRLLPRFSAVTVSTPLLAEKLAPFNGNIHILPNLVDEQLFLPAPPKSEGPVVIGFCGTGTHARDLQEMEEALFRIAQTHGNRVAFFFMGYATSRHMSLPGFKFSDFERNYESYAGALSASGIDIAIVPLEDNSFNRCKSNIKWLEYSACGIAGVYSNLPPYSSSIRQGETGILVGPSADEWYHALDYLIRNPGQRQAMASQARSEVLGKYSLTAGAPLYLDTYRKILTGKEVQCSIIIPVFNKMEYTRQCLEALWKVTGEDVSLEIIVIDNASTDGTRGYLQSLGNKVRVIENNANLGFARACNQGSASAQGRYLVFLNNDTVPHAGWLKALVQGIEQDGADICGARLLYPDGTVQHAGVAFNDNSIGYHIFNRFPAEAPAVNKKRFMQCVTAACMIIPKPVFQELGGFDEGYQNGFEDVDLCLRAASRGRKILYNPASTLVHFEETSDGRKQHDRENMLRFLSRWQGKVICDDDRIYAEEGYRKELLGEGRIRIIPIAPKNEARTELQPAPATTVNQETPAQFSLVPLHTRRYHILLVAPLFPEYDRITGRFRLLQLVKILCRMGHSVTYAIHSGSEQILQPPYLAELITQGIELQHFDAVQTPSRLYEMTYVYGRAIDVATIRKVKELLPKTHCLLDMTGFQLAKQLEDNLPLIGTEMLAGISPATIIIESHQEREAILTAMSGTKTELVPYDPPDAMEVMLAAVIDKALTSAVKGLSSSNRVKNALRQYANIL